MRARVLAVVFAILSVSPVFAQQCLHGADERPEQAARRREALNASRLVNTLQANQPGAAQKTYLRHEDLAAAAAGMPPMFRLAPGESIVAGWQLSLDVTPRGYWFAITDTTDPCGFRYISNEQGLILTAEPIR